MELDLQKHNTNQKCDSCNKSLGYKEVYVGHFLDPSKPEKLNQCMECVKTKPFKNEKAMFSPFEHGIC